MTEHSTPIFYGVVVARTGAKRYRWSPAFETPTQAAKWGEKAIEKDDCPVSFVVRVENGEKDVMPTFTQPRKANRILELYLDLLDELEPVD